jgi:methionine-gamma-lyase
MRFILPSFLFLGATAFQAPVEFSRAATSLGVAQEIDIQAAEDAISGDSAIHEESPSKSGLRKEPLAHAKPKSFATKCASLYRPNAGAERGLATPIYFGSTFLLDDAAHGARLHEKREAPYTDEDGFVYSRWGSPTNEAAALQIAALEGVDEPEKGLGRCLLFNSGMSAITSALQAVLRNGDHVVAPYTVYGGTYEFLTEFADSWGIEVTFVDGAGPDGPENYKKAFKENTRVIYTETPANPTMRLTDLEGVGRVVDEFYGKADDTPGTSPHDRIRPYVMVDGTFATPYHHRVLDIPGIDVSIHSATKYLGGHSDILAGSVTSRSEPFLHGCSKVQKIITVPLNPMDSFLLARGLKTLDVRMQRHGENAIKVARMLDEHPMVAQTFYPGLDSHPDRAMADAMFRSGRDSDDEEYKQTYGGMISFITVGEDDEALRRAQNVCERLRVINLAVSLGGVESLCEHPASMTHTMISREQRMAGGLHDGLVRVSIGLEKAEDLVQDLKNALDLCDQNAQDGFDI